MTFGSEPDQNARSGVKSDVWEDGSSLLVYAQEQTIWRQAALRVRDQKATFASHSITSSAATSIEGGTVNPSDFAVFTFTNSSNLVG
jgi:hypothetical protein